MDWIRSLFSFEGRYNRARLLLAIAITFGWHIYWAVAGVIVGDVSGLTGNPVVRAILPIPFAFDFTGGHAALMSAGLLLIVTLPVNIVPLWISAASWVKRLHDRNKSGWWAVPLCAVPYLYIHFILTCGQLDISLAMPTLITILAVPVCLLSAWALIELYLLPGTDGRNRFGADPLSRANFKSSGPSQPGTQGAPTFLLQGVRQARIQP